MINGLWSGVSESNVSNVESRPIVLIFQDGKIYGGNSSAYFLGEYHLEGNQLHGELLATHYHGPPLSIFGLFAVGESTNFILQATVMDERITGEAVISDNPKLRSKFEFTKRAEL